MSARLTVAATVALAIGAGLALAALVGWPAGVGAQRAPRLGRPAPEITFPTRAGVDTKTVQTWLDRAQITTTLGIYAHSDEPTMLKAARQLERGLQPKKPRSPGAVS